MMGPDFIQKDTTSKQEYVSSNKITFSLQCLRGDDQKEYKENTKNKNRKKDKEYKTSKHSEKKPGFNL